MEKPSYKLVGAPCGQHGQYTFYKAIKLTGLLERIVAIGDFFFVKIWQDSELISIGELQLLWTDRVSDQTLVSLRLYFLPENTPDGRGQHGEHEVLAINDKVVLRAEDLLSWVCVGREWRWGLRAVWRGDCAPPPAAPAPAPPHTAPLHHTRLDFSDVDKEKSAITIDEEAPGVVVFSYPRYCRYRALAARLAGVQARWLRDSLVAALGGYAAPTRNTRILYCKDTFEYPELEGHEFVCNHLAPKLKGRPRGRRRRAADRSPGRSPPRSDSRSSDSDGRHTPDNKTHRRLSLRNGPDRTDKPHRPDKPEKEEGAENGQARLSPEDEAFMSQLYDFYRDKSDTLKIAHTLKHMSLRLIYLGVVSRGGYEAVCRDKLWRHLYADLGPRVRRLYERCLLPFENHERRLSKKYLKGLNGKVEEKVDTIEVGDSPLRDDKRLRTPSPAAPAPPAPHLDQETGEVIKEEMTVTSKPAEELNREFLESLPEPERPAKISVKPVEKLIEPALKDALEDDDKRDALHDAPKSIGNSEGGAGAAWRGGPARAPLADLGPLAAHTDNHNGHAKSRPAGRSSLRAVRVKPARPPPQPAPAAQPAPTSSGRAGPSPPNNFGIHHPPPPAQPPAPPAPPHSDDDIVEVPYKPKSPEIIDLDEYPESPQAVKRKKLDILKERGLEVTAVPPAWGAVPLPGAMPLPGAVPLLPAPLLHPLLAPAQLYQMYNILPPSYPNGAPAPKVIQAVSAFGTAGPEKTVYGNPKDPFMPPPHVLGRAPLRSRPQSPPARDVLDLTCPPPEPRAPAVEIVRVPSTPSPAAPPAPPATAQNLAKSYTLLDGKAVVGSNLEITLVDPKAQTPPKQRPPQKRNSNGKFAAKTPTPPRDYKYPSPSGGRAVPYPARDESPTGSTGSRDSASSGYVNAFKAPGALPFDPLYVSSLYGGLGQMDQRQLAVYREFVASQFRGYSGLLNIGPPTTKN